MTEKDEGTGRQNEKEQSSSRLWTPYSDPGKRGEETGREKRSAGGEKEGLSEEELRRRLEEAMEKVTVADVLYDMMVTLSSMAYQRMGLPREANEKFKDMAQAKQAINAVEALFETLRGEVEEEKLAPLERTIDNLKLNFAKES